MQQGNYISNRPEQRGINNVSAGFGTNIHARTQSKQQLGGREGAQARGGFQGVEFPSLAPRLGTLTAVCVAKNLGAETKVEREVLSQTCTLLMDLLKAVAPQVITEKVWERDTNIVELLNWLMEQTEATLGSKYQYKLALYGSKQVSLNVGVELEGFGYNTIYAMEVDFLAVIAETNPELHYYMLEALKAFRRKTLIDTWEQLEHGSCYEWFTNDADGWTDLDEEEQKEHLAIVEDYASGTRNKYEYLLNDTSLMWEDIQVMFQRAFIHCPIDMKEDLKSWHKRLDAVMCCEGNIGSFDFVSCSIDEDEEDYFERPVLPSELFAMVWTTNDSLFSYFKDSVCQRGQAGQLSCMSSDFFHVGDKEFVPPVKSDFPSILIEFIYKHNDFASRLIPNSND